MATVKQLERNRLTIQRFPMIACSVTYAILVGMLYCQDTRTQTVVQVYMPDPESGGSRGRRRKSSSLCYFNTTTMLLWRLTKDVRWLVYSRGQQPLWNWELIQGYLGIWRANLYQYQSDHHFKCNWSKKHSNSTMFDSLVDEFYF